jgi:aminopeptidase N
MVSTRRPGHVRSTLTGPDFLGPPGRRSARLTRPLVTAAAAALAAPLVLAAPASAGSGDNLGADLRGARPGAESVGDRLFPTLGNGGYDALHYDLGMTYQAATRTVEATTTMTAVATQNLSRFSLDFDGNTITSVRLDGGPVAFARHDEKLVITPARPIRAGTPLRLAVAYHADPRSTAFTCVVPPPATPSAWVPIDSGFVDAGQPNCEHTVFPSNDHPSDKATYTFRLTVPQGTTAVANGRLVSTFDGPDRTTTTSVYREDAPMASELTQIVVGDFTVAQVPGAAGVALRNVVSTASAAQIEPVLTQEAEQVAWMVDRAGPYPFGVYGELVPDGIDNLGFALETQTLSLFPSGFIKSNRNPVRVQRVLVHELAHQWFGDSVAPATWSDIWLNEGHATWYEDNWADPDGSNLLSQMHDAYAASDRMRAADGPVALPDTAEVMFDNNSYDGGALVLYALRQEVGDATFARIERAWQARFHGRDAGTADFIALSSAVAGRDLRGFLTPWLYSRSTPAMPGHPDWTVLPVQPAAAPSVAAAAHPARAAR